MIAAMIAVTRPPMMPADAQQWQQQAGIRPIAPYPPQHPQPIAPHPGIQQQQPFLPQHNVSGTLPDYR